MMGVHRPLEGRKRHMNDISNPAPKRWGKNGSSNGERLFLQGPQPRRFELARAVRIFMELVKGFRALHFVGPCVTVFGSARFPEDHPCYAQALEIGGRLVEAG